MIMVFHDKMSTIYDNKTEQAEHGEPVHVDYCKVRGILQLDVYKMMFKFN
jgi:hypothetical protein